MVLFDVLKLDNISPHYIENLIFIEDLNINYENIKIISKVMSLRSQEHIFDVVILR